MTLDKRSAAAGTLQYHIKLRPGDVGRFALLPGDPDRVLRIARHLDAPRELAFHREYRSATGTYAGIEVAGVSTGIGAPSAAIAVEELANIGVTHFIRVGSSAALVPGIAPGDIIINTASMRLDGTTAGYVEPGFPAVADHFLTAALIQAAAKLSTSRGFNFHVGINATSDAFYAETPDKVEMLRRHRLTNIEMESSAIFTVAHLRGLHAAMVCAVSYNFLEPESVEYGGENPALAQGWEDAIAVALEGIRIYETDGELRRKVEGER